MRGGSLPTDKVPLQKRLQTLPLRMSPTSKRRSIPPNFPPPYPQHSSPTQPDTITPSDSDSEDPNRATYHQNAQHDPRSLGGQTWQATVSSTDHRPPSFTMEPGPVDGDMDMMMDGPDLHLQSTPASEHLEPGPSQPDPISSSSITNRMPTPIHCSFAAQVRGNNWGGAAGNVMQAVPQTQQPQREPYHGVGMLGHESIPRSLDGPTATAAVMADWNQVQNRRLPSPISETGGEEGSEALGSPPGMILDSSMGHLNCHGHQHPLLSSLPPRANSAMEMGSGPTMGVPPRFATPNNIDSGGVSPESPNESAMEVDAGTSPKKGHTRSRHTLNSWTLQPGMKKSFSIGYRADCEKCRMKVPGHFNHIIVS